ncbi:HS12B-like protein [Mya arenaria]|uniref:HS12B-like protein n=1 Tax=Mya arenaria TaxID=6604 RepID=A0ABY7DAB6_MYAAR|nr:HS12B-like protein [Mya arenaria]
MFMFYSRNPPHTALDVMSDNVVATESVPSADATGNTPQITPDVTFPTARPNSHEKDMVIDFPQPRDNVVPSLFKHKETRDAPKQNGTQLTTVKSKTQPRGKDGSQTPRSTTRRKPCPRRTQSVSARLENLQHTPVDDNNDKGILTCFVPFSHKNGDCFVRFDADISKYLYLKQSKPLLVAAIDFGTTYSSWAFSFRHENESDPTQISAKQCQGECPTKEPTTVLIQPDGKTLEAFGFEAETRYTELIDEDEHESYFFFKRFKMKLWNQASGTIDITVHGVLRSMEVKELCKANGGAWGGTKVDEAFKCFINDIAGFDAMGDLKRNHLYDFIDLFRRFENKKPSISPDKDSKTIIPLPQSLCTLIEKRQGRALCDLIKNTYYASSHIEIGQKLKVGETQFKRRYVSIESDQSSIVFPIFITYEKNPMYTTDPGCTCVGNLTIPLSRSGKDREVIVRFIFGGTEIVVEATEKSTRKVHHLKIDFLV